jgi:16S rRNA (guanine(1405)-N(7))-methyltransferase
MHGERDDMADRIVAAIAAIGRHRDVAPDVVRRVALEEIPKRSSFAETLKATKARLHQIGGAFLSPTMPFDRWLAELRDADLAMRPDICKRIMASHASTRERLPLLDALYATIFADLPPIHSVLDLACGLHPLALPWMPLAPGATYHAYDIYEPMMRFIDAFLELSGVAGSASTWDLVQGPPPMRADLAFILKTLPCLELTRQEAGKILLTETRARFLVVSFPLHTLGGHRKGMGATYERHFAELTSDQSWQIRRYAFTSELVFVIDRGG